MRIFINIALFGAVLLSGIYIYVEYGTEIIEYIFQEEVDYIIYLDNVPVEVTLADNEAERVRGLSGTESLEAESGKLFVFDTDKKYGIWMKEMNYPLDIIWINSDLKVVHIETLVDPSTYPQVFAPNEPARFVLETNAYFVDTMRIEVGDTMNAPPEILPADIRKNLIK